MKSGSLWQQLLELSVYIGKRDGLPNGITTIGHLLGGYNYSKKLGYDLLAKICITHSCPTKSINDIDYVVNKNCKR